ncbi:PH domain-containing protein [Nannocystis pusilla]|uniref:PH domain-containing protein n=1 Tax=Nannocystis pusilla TaxID=889268 RepID=UPI003B7612AD
MAPLDEVQLATGERVHGRVTDIAEGQYVSVRGAKGTETFPWTEVARVRLERGVPEDAVELGLAGKGFEANLPVTADTPYIELQTRDGRPVPLLRLRNSDGDVSERYSTGFDEVCRARAAARSSQAIAGSSSTATHGRPRRCSSFRLTRGTCVCWFVPATSACVRRASA